MKRYFLFVFIAFFGVLSTLDARRNQPAEPQGGFELTVRIHGYPEGEALRLGRFWGTQTLVLDTAVFDERRGVFVFRRDEPLQGGMYILVSHTNFPAEFIVDQYQHFSIELRYPEFGVDMQFTGSPENQIFTDFNAQIRPLHQEIGELRRQHSELTDRESPQGQALNEQMQAVWSNINQLQTQFMSDNPQHLMTAVFRAQRDIEVPEAPDYIPEDEQNNWRYNYWKRNFFNNMDLTDSRLLRTGGVGSPTIFHQRLTRFLDVVLMPTPDSIISGLDHLISQVRGDSILFQYVIWYTTDRFMRSQIIGHDAIWVHLVDRYYLTGDAFWVSEATLENFQRAADRARPLLIGAVPSEFASPDLDGRWRSVFEATRTNRYTVVVFWESRCGHCRRMMPILRDFYNERREDLDFEIFAVYQRSGDTQQDWRDYLNTNNMKNWINVHGGNSTARWDQDWDVTSVPTIFILDNQRRIVTRRINVEQIEPFIRNWNAMHFSN